MSEHRIRLRGPWQLFLPNDAAPHRVTLPNILEIPPNIAMEEIKITRDFNWLAKLEPDDQALLEIKGAAGLVRVKLNQQELVRAEGNQAANRFVCTPLLRPRNHLELYFIAVRETNPNELGDSLPAKGHTKSDEESSKLQVGVAEEVELVMISR